MITGVLLAMAVATNAATNPYNTAKQKIAALRSLPPAVREFVERRAGCNHWAGEPPYDQERAAEIRSALSEGRCADLLKDEAALKRQYMTDRMVLNVLEASRGWLADEISE